MAITDEQKAFGDYLRGYTLDDISSKRDIPIGTIKSWMHRKNWADKKKGCILEDGSLDREMLKKYVDNSSQVMPPGMGRTAEDYIYDSPHDAHQARRIKNALHNSLRYLANKQPNSDYECEKRLESYFLTCEESGIIPTLEGVWLCLGISRGTYDAWVGGKSGTVRADIMRRAQLCVHEFNTQMALGGYIPQSLYMFVSKNYHGMKDQVDSVVTHINPLGDAQDIKALEERYNSISIDVVENGPEQGTEYDEQG